MTSPRRRHSHFGKLGNSAPIMADASSLATKRGAMEMQAVQEVRFAAELAMRVPYAMQRGRRQGKAIGSLGVRRFTAAVRAVPPSDKGQRSGQSEATRPDAATSLCEIRWQHPEMVVRRRRCVHGL